MTLERLQHLPIPPQQTFNLAELIAEQQLRSLCHDGGINMTLNTSNDNNDECTNSPASSFNNLEINQSRSHSSDDEEDENSLNTTQQSLEKVVKDLFSTFTNGPSANFLAYPFYTAAKINAVSSSKMDFHLEKNVQQSELQQNFIQNSATNSTGVVAAPSLHKPTDQHGGSTTTTEAVALALQHQQHVDQQQMSMREPKPYKCAHCVKAFANNSYLSQHMRIHMGMKPFGPCNYCGKKFTQLSHLQQHIRTHTGEKPYKCKYSNCDKQFSQLSNLQSHSRCHQSDKPYKCNSCYKCFTDETALLEHIPKHKDSKHLKASCAKEKVHICAFCGKSYTQALYLEKHMTKHTERARNGVPVAITTGEALRFPKNYYNGEFTPESFDSLNQLNQNLNQLNHNEEFALRHFQMAAAAAQQNAAVAATTTYAGYPNVAASAASAVVANQLGQQINNQISNQALSQFNLFQRSLQRNFSDNMNTTLRNNTNERTATGFNMITPLENIKHFNQNTAAATATANFQ